MARVRKSAAARPGSMTRPPAFDPTRASSAAATRDGPCHNPVRARRRSRSRSLPALGLLLIASHQAEAQGALSIDIPIALRTDDVRKALASAVPATIEQDAWTDVDGWGLKFAARRGSFTVTAAPGGLAASVLLEYRATACRRIGRACPQPASCGDGAPQAATQLEVAGTGTWSPDWSFTPKADVHATPVRPCLVTPARDLGPWVSAQIEGKARAAIAGPRCRLQLRAAAEARWASAAVRDLGNHLWLVLQPDQIAIAPMTVRGGELRSSAAIRATPRLVAQELRPKVPPLPTLTVLKAPAPAPPGDAPSVWHLTLTVPWSSLASTVAALPLDLGNGISGRLTGLRGTKDGHILGTLTVTGTRAGVVSLDTAARYDAGSDTLVVDHLVAAPRTGAVKSGAIAVVSAFLRPHLRWPVGPRLRRVVERLADTGWVSDVDASRSTLKLTVSTAGVVLDVAFPGSLTLPVDLQS